MRFQQGFIYTRHLHHMQGKRPTNQIIIGSLPLGVVNRSVAAVPL
jgi:hypothetical protein